MKRKVFHVGLMKSGTTYIQEILSQNRDYLRKQGWLYPGMRLNQQQACYSLCGDDIPWTRDPSPKRLGDDLANAVCAAKENIILSAEALSSLSDEGIARFIDKVGRPDTVVFTIRGLDKTLPSAWQQYLKGGGQVSFMPFIRKLARDRDDLSGFWRTYAFGHAVAKWAKHSSVEVVTVPQNRTPTDELWNRFRSATGLPELTLRDVPVEKANVSLSLEAAEVLRHVNKELRKTDRDGDGIRSEYLDRAVFPMANQDGGQKIVLPAKASAIVEEWNNEECEILVANNTRIHGSVDDLARAAVNDSPEPKVDENRLQMIAAAQIIALLKKN